MPFKKCNIVDYLGQVSEESFSAFAKEQEKAPWLFLVSPDPFIEKILLDDLSQKFDRSYERQVVFAKELSLDWIEEHWQEQGLFKSQEYYVVFNCEDLKKEIWKELEQKRQNFEQTSIVFCFSKMDKNLKKVEALDNAFGLIVEEAKFWQGIPFIMGLAKKKNINLNIKLAQWLVQALSATTSEYIRALDLLGLELAVQGTIELEQIKKLFPLQKLDSFKLAGFYCAKKTDLFFKEALSLNVSDQEWEEFFRFMQYHLLKLANSQELKKKDRPSKYDKELIEHSKLWQAQEIASESRFFSKLQILAKQKSSQIKHQLCLRYLEQI